MSKAPWNGAAFPRQLSTEHFEKAARRLGCETAAIRAVWEVEASGRHFLNDGSVVRRFEPHHFPSSHWSRIGFSVRQGEAPWRASLRLSNETMFQKAASLDLQSACRASSWGAPQIMGFNHKDAGFNTPEDMVVHMAKGAPEQLGAFVQLIEAWGLATALIAHDWQRFARRYNGTGNVQEYARRIEAAYRKHSGQSSPVILRVGARGSAVKELQKVLGIEDDGAFGPETLQAVRNFQRMSGLTVDGIVGAKTWEALRGQSNEVQPPSQDTPTDAIVDQIKNWSGAASAAGGAGATIAAFLPPQALTLLVGGVVVLGVVFGILWIWRNFK